MPWLLTTVLLATLAQPARDPGLYNATIDVESVGTVTYGLWVPQDYDADEPRPLVLALHPGGSPGAGYGMQFLRSVVAPALQEWGAVVVSPDAPGGRWDNETSERGVLALIDDVRARYAIDPARILVTGFSMGGRGTWYMASRHPDLFKAAIPMAARTDSDAARQVGDMPGVHHPRPRRRGGAVRAGRADRAGDGDAGTDRVVPAPSTASATSG